MEKTKLLYASPESEVVELRPEGIIATSEIEGGGEGFTFNE